MFMSKYYSNSRARLGILFLSLALGAAGCAASAKNEMFFGKVQPPRDNVLHYVSGSESESLDPQFGTTQNDARIYMSMFEGLVEYDPKDMHPIPAIAERWENNSTSSELVFHLRKNARWSNGDPITAQDFVYTFRRGLTPEFAFRNAYLAYYIKYGQAFNSGGVFVRDPQSQQFLLEKDVTPEVAKNEAAPSTGGEDPALDTPFHHFMHSPARLVIPGDLKERAAAFKADPKLAEAVKGMEYVAVTAEDIGVEAIDDYTFRLTLSQSAPFFIQLIPHQFFRAVPRKAIEQYKEKWTQDANMICSGAFKLKTWRPYDKIVVERNPMYWDVANVKLDQIVFYPVQEAITVMNLYKAGEIDATPNHQVPVGWVPKIMKLKDYMDAPEVAVSYFDFNTKKPPLNDKRVRKALNLTVDKTAYAEWRKIVKPLTAFTPEGLFPDYPRPKGDDFNPEKAKQLLAEAGFKDASGKFDPKKFPVNDVEITYNPDGSNQQVSEWLQAQWKQNLGITLPLKAVEWRTFAAIRPRLEYKGLARDGWVGDYMDPFTFLNLFYTGGENGTGWSDPKYDEMLDEANRALDPKKRFELLAKAEAFLLDAQPFVPLDTDATNWVKKPYVKGMYPNPGTLHAWKFVYIERDQAKWDYGVPDMKP